MVGSAIASCGVSAETANTEAATAITSIRTSLILSMAVTLFDGDSEDDTSRLHIPSGSGVQRGVGSSPACAIGSR